MGNKSRFYADLQSLQSTVTGSNNLVTVSYPDGRKEPFLVDFGMYQGSREQEELNDKIGFKPEKLVAIFLLMLTLTIVVEFQCCINMEQHAEH